MFDIELKINLINSEAKLPSYSHDGDAGLDLYSTIENDLLPGKSCLVPLGFNIELPSKMEAQIRPRSGLALKHQITVLNSPGTIDSGYRGEVGVILINHGDKIFNITKGMKIAQMVIKPVLNIKVVIGEVSNQTSRGIDGYGSSGMYSNPS
jgi:dUTP pyrophosphatase